MNLLHLKYAVEVAATGSINKAAESLMIAQPNLSRSIKALETDIGITIFERSPKGMFLTADGEEFITYAKSILHQIEDVEKMYKYGSPTKYRFSVSVPSSSYISYAFAQFSKTIPENYVEIFYRETNPSKAIKNILFDDCKLGIIRYASSEESRYQTLLSEKDLTSLPVCEFRYRLIFHQDNPLAKLSEIHYSDFKDLIEIFPADPYAPTFTPIQTKIEDISDNAPRRIFVHERASQFDLLAENHATFIWAPPIPQKICQRYKLIQRECVDNEKTYKDVVVFKKNYQLTHLDKRFIEQIKNI